MSALGTVIARRRGSVRHRLGSCRPVPRSSTGCAAVRASGRLCLCCRHDCRHGHLPSRAHGLAAGHLPPRSLQPRWLRQGPVRRATCFELQCRLSTGAVLLSLQNSLSLHSRPVVKGFLEKRLNSIQCVVADPETKTCAIIDPMLDFDLKSGSTVTHSVNELLATLSARATPWSGSTRTRRGAQGLLNQPQ
jgi:hypothetical protein